MICPKLDSREFHNAYACAKPFPHTLFRGLFDWDLLRKVSTEFQTGKTELWRKIDSKNTVNKFACNDPKLWGPSTKEFINELQSKDFCKWLSKMTGHRKLISDPNFFGGGLHATGTGGRLEIHADFNYSHELKSRRVLGLLIYLNDNWNPSWGGELELWNRQMSKCVVKIPPRMNTTVVFNTDDDSNHGHPHPLSCPEGVFRKSIALYYYNKGETVEVPHTMLYKTRRD